MDSNIIRAILGLIERGEASEENIRRALFPIELAVSSSLPYFVSAIDELWALRKKLGDESNNEGDPGMERAHYIAENLRIAADMFKD